MRSKIIIILLACMLFSGTASAQYHFESLNFNATCSGSFCSFGRGINNSGDVVGWGQIYVEEGFLLEATGVLSILQYPGAPKTRACGINARGDIVGHYTDPKDNRTRAFLREKNGTYWTIDYPGSTSSSVWGINSRGQVVGGYSDSGGYSTLIYATRTDLSKASIFPLL